MGCQAALSAAKWVLTWLLASEGQILWQTTAALQREQGELLATNCSFMQWLLMEHIIPIQSSQAGSEACPLNVSFTSQQQNLPSLSFSCHQFIKLSVELNCRGFVTGRISSDSIRSNPCSYGHDYRPSIKCGRLENFFRPLSIGFQTTHLFC